MPLPLSTSARILFLKGDMKKIYFVNFYKPKDHKQYYKNKEATDYRKMSNQNTKESPGIEVEFFNCAAVMPMNNFDCLTIFLFYFYFIKNL